jgi:hypothetical protein
MIFVLGDAGHLSCLDSEKTGGMAYQIRSLSPMRLEATPNMI